MGNFEFKLNRAGVEQLLNSDEMFALMEEKGNTVLNRCPADLYGMQTYTGVMHSQYGTSTRAIATVGTRGAKGAIDNRKNNTLLKALGGGT